MKTSRRGLLKALGLGSVGLVTGMGVKDLIASEADRITDAKAEAPRLPEAPHLQSAPVEAWEHPEMDRIQAILTLTGGYPNFYGDFPNRITAMNGDVLKINYEMLCDNSSRAPVTLYRVYDVLKSITAIGTSIQGPIVEDKSTPLGHRLATLDELRPDEEASLDNNIDEVARRHTSFGNGMC